MVVYVHTDAIYYTIVYFLRPWYDINLKGEKGRVDGIIRSCKGAKVVTILFRDINHRNTDTMLVVLP